MRRPRLHRARRRGVAAALALACVATACTSGGADGVPATSPEPGTAPADLGDSVSSTAPPTSSDGVSDVTGRDAGPALPGLVDDTDMVLSNDDAVRTGVLDNGLRYYIRANDNPGGKADLRLVVRAGSVDEFGPSTGTAHFVEHMLFNGTERFPENELIDVLRSFGASFGPDINAYTSFDETVYSLVVPNDESTVELGLEVLAQWLTAATFDPDEVVAERGVVLDEWRIRTQTTSGRLFEIAADMYLGGSPYAGRTPIGTESSIAELEADELRAFYDRWYRPDNVAVVIVGDIDVDVVAGEIERWFGAAVPRTESTPDRPDTTFDLVTGPDFRLHSDPDQQTVDVEVTLPLPTFESDGVAADRAALIDVMIFDILVQRLAGDIAAGSAPFDDIAPGTNSFVEGLDAPALYAFTDVVGVRATLDALLDEYQRAHLHGFTETELDAARSSVLASFETSYEGRDSTQDRVFADALVEHFLRGVAYPSIADEFDAVTAELEAMTLTALAERFSARWSNSWPHVIISVPEAQADQMPGREEVIEAASAAYERDVAPREPMRDLPDELIERPEPADPVTIGRLTDQGWALFDPIVVTFGNGVRVVLNPNDIVTGEIFVSAASPGGSSLVADADVVDALFADEIVTASGVGDFNAAELAQIVAGTDIELTAYLSPYREGFGGSTAAADVETLLQLLRLYMTAPRVDRVALDQVVASYGAVVSDPSLDPAAARDDALLDVRYDAEPRYTLLPSPSEFATLDVDGVRRVWTERFGNTGDWVFAFSGDLDVEEMIELTSSYLGTLPTTLGEETWIDVAPSPPADVESVDVVAGSGDTGSVTLLFTSPVAGIEPVDRALTDVVTALVGARLAAVVREEFGETYSPFAVTYFTTDPEPVIETYVNVTGSPDRLDEIVELVVGEFKNLRTEPLAADEFERAFAEIEEQYGFVDNGQFLTAIIDDLVDPFLPVEGYLAQYTALFDVTDADVSAFVVDHITPDAHIEVIVTPR